MSWHLDLVFFQKTFQHPQLKSPTGVLLKVNPYRYFENIKTNLEVKNLLRNAK